MTQPLDVEHHVLTRSQWQERERAHATHADRLTAGHRERRARGQAHPIEDFLFTYYPVRPGHLRRWSPGVGIGLADAADSRLAGARWFAMVDGVVRLDAPAFLSDRGAVVRHHANLLQAVAQRPPTFSCFGLHEWAMVYREPEAARRHPLPLRLGSTGTDAVVERHRIVCSHHDAFRFFTPEAAGRNTLQPTRERQVELDNPGCLHVGMDLVRACLHLGPAVPGEVLLAAFELARDIRELDMRASPYDVSGFGLEPVAIETDAGKAAYVAAQRDFTVRAQPLRAALIRVCAVLLDEAIDGAPAPPAGGEPAGGSGGSALGFAGTTRRKRAQPGPEEACQWTG